MPSTLGSMTTNVLRKLGDTNAQFFTTAEVKQAIGESYRIYYMRLIRESEGFFTTTRDLDIVSGVEAITLTGFTPPFKSISKLWRYVTNGIIPLKEQEDRFVSVYTLAVGTGDAYVPQYYQRGTDLVLYPPPGATQTSALKLNYVYTPTFPTSVSSDAFTFDANFPDVYEINVELRAAIKCMETKDSSGGLSDMSTFRDELVELDKAFQDSFENDEYPDSVQYKGMNYRNGGYY